jgi:formylglycine-generating enzyme required for sulfatase activity/tRNA A-37 threonylcarbamoyl transferase component Bud32
MFCSKCGNENKEDAMYCVGCGAVLLNQTPIEKKYTPASSGTLGSLPTIHQAEIKVDSFKVGSLFADRYEILSEGKQGGMGAVYECKDTTLDENVALKIIHPKLINSKQAISRFRQEVAVSRKLQHPNIVRVYNLEKWRGKEYFTMEWVEGVTLRDILSKHKKQNEPFSLEEANNIISQLSNALHYAHSHTVHRDIKPENILVEYSKEETAKNLTNIKIRLTDFGIAKMLSPSSFTMSSMQMGTPYYMAPEQKTDAGKVDKRADIYAAGVVLFELLTLENTIGFELPSEINKELPKEIDSIIKKAVTTKPEDRFDDIKELSESLDKVVVVYMERVEEERRRSEELKRQEEESKRREAEERKQREEREKDLRDREESERREKEAREEQIRERKRKKQEDGTSSEPKWAIIIPAVVCVVIGIVVAVILGTGGGSKSTYVKEHSSNTSAYTGPVETMREGDVSRSSSTKAREVDYVDMVLVRGGSFEMGDTFGDGDDDEKPVHNVSVGDFYMGKYEVTQGEWEEIMGNNPSGFKHGNKYPVNSVSCDDIQGFIRKLYQRTGMSYRLPTEAEWEYAARSGGGREKFSGTNIESSLGKYAWYGDNSNKESHPVGKKKPNGLGIFDMSGNVWEWCQDTYSSDAYTKHQRNNPIYIESKSGSPPVSNHGGSVYLVKLMHNNTSESGSRRVCRGGDRGGEPRDLRASSRGGSVTDGRFTTVGFRLARTP